MEISTCGDKKGACRPLFYVLLAKCHYNLSKNYGAYLQTKRALELLTQELGSQDAVLRQAVEYLCVLNEPEPDLWDKEEEAGLVFVEYKRLEPHDSKGPPVKLSPAALGKLDVLRQSDSDLTEFARLACVTSNELEGVSALAGDSVTYLVKQGFVDNAIKGISRQNQIKQKQQVFRILENAMACFPVILPFVRENNLGDSTTIRFSDQRLKNLHSTLLQSDNVYAEDFEDRETRHVLSP